METGLVVRYQRASCCRAISNHLGGGWAFGKVPNFKHLKESQAGREVGQRILLASP